MKKLLVVLALAFSIPAMATDKPADKPAETKKACVEQKDAKTGKTKEVCKEVKVHKKLEGTKVPDKK